MNISGLIGKKIDQTQNFLEDGTRVPVSLLMVSPNVVTQVKTTEKDGYNAIQLGFDIRKKATKALLGHIKKAGIEKTPRFLREIREEKIGEAVVAGTEIKAEDVFKPGDIVDVTGVSKGKGFAGVVKRHGFRGGPRTHGQSDRERAPGSIGQTTTPGRVYKGKKMAGRMGGKRVTIKNLEVLSVVDNLVYIKGLIPGIKDSTVMIKKKGENKKFVSLFKREVVEEKVEDKPIVKVEKPSPVKTSLSSEVKVDKAESESFSVKTLEDKPTSVENTEDKKEEKENEK